MISIIVGQKSSTTLPEPLVLLPHCGLLQLFRLDHDPLPSHAHKESLLEGLVAELTRDHTSDQRLEDQALKRASHLEGSLILNHDLVKNFDSLNQQARAFPLNNFVVVADFQALLH